MSNWPKCFLLYTSAIYTHTGFFLLHHRLKLKHLTMMKPQLHHQPQPFTHQALVPALLLSNQFLHGSNSVAFPRCCVPKFRKTHNNGDRLGVSRRNGVIKAVANPTTRTSTSQGTTTVKAVVTVKPSTGGIFSEMGINRGLDDIADLLGKTLLLELVSSELDSSELMLFTTVIFPFKEKFTNI